MNYRTTPNVFAVASFNYFTEDGDVTSAAAKRSAASAATLMGCVARPSDCAQTARLFVRPAKIGRFGDVDKIVLVETSVTNSSRSHHFRRCRRIVMLDSSQNGEPARSDSTSPAHIIRPSRRHFHRQSIQFLSSNSSIKSVSQNYMFKYKFHLHSIGNFSDGRQ